MESEKMKKIIDDEDVKKKYKETYLAIKEQADIDIKNIQILKAHHQKELKRYETWNYILAFGSMAISILAILFSNVGLDEYLFWCIFVLYGILGGGIIWVIKKCQDVAFDLSVIESYEQDTKQ